MLLDIGILNLKDYPQDFLPKGQRFFNNENIKKLQKFKVNII